jgi:hypothetical protein
MGATMVGDVSSLAVLWAARAVLRQHTHPPTWKPYNRVPPCAQCPGDGGTCRMETWARAELAAATPATPTP